MAQTNIGKSGNAGLVTLTGDAGIGDAAAIKDALVAAVAGHDDLIIDVSGVTAADLSLFQLVYAAMLSMRAKGGRLSLTGLDQIGAAAAARSCGFSGAAWFAKLTGAEPENG
jgi:anti-anti-sigma regulatory factor